MQKKKTETQKIFKAYFTGYDDALKMAARIAQSFPPRLVEETGQGQRISDAILLLQLDNNKIKRKFVGDQDESE
jgi:hypothetical protein